MNTRKMWKLIFFAPVAIVALAAVVALIGAVGGEAVKLLWNWLLPPIFGVRPITFWQALGMLALCRILFGGHVYRSHSRRRTPEERERFRQGMRDRFGFAGGKGPGGGAAPVSL